MSKGKFMSYPEMVSSLRAGSIAGMETRLTLDPEGAAAMADMIEAHLQSLYDEIEEAFAPLLSDDSR
jgi:hypothetical protein